MTISCSNKKKTTVRITLSYQEARDFVNFQSVRDSIAKDVHAVVWPNANVIQSTATQPK